MDDLHPSTIAPMPALVGSRLCHDLVSPLGAISNGLELLAMTGTAPSPELALIADAVADADARIRFFRIAFGHAEPHAMVKGREMAETLHAIYGTSRTELRWEPSTDMTRASAKTLFLMLNCIDRAMPMGGTVTVTARDGGGWTLEAESPRLAYDADLWAKLSPGARMDGLKPAFVQFALLAEDLSQRAAIASVELDETRLRLRA